MNPVFLDTVGLLSLWDRSDQWHAAAESAYNRIISKRQPFLTTTFVLLECGNAAARRTYRTQVCTLREALEQRNELVVPTEDDWTKGWEAYRRGETAQAGIVDHVSFVVMRRLGITEAFTNDKYVQAAGFLLLFRIDEISMIGKCR